MDDESFDNIPVEEDTRIWFRVKANLGEYPVCYEKWSCEGIQAESIIFKHVDTEQLLDGELEELVRSSPLIKSGSGITLKRNSGGFTFVNFNFVCSDDE